MKKIAWMLNRADGSFTLIASNNFSLPERTQHHRRIRAARQIERRGAFAQAALGEFIRLGLGERPVLCFDKKLALGFTKEWPLEAFDAEIGNRDVLGSENTLVGFIPGVEQVGVFREKRKVEIAPGGVHC